MRHVYLAGPISGLTWDEANGWRTNQLLLERLDAQGWKALNPLANAKHLAPSEGPLDPFFEGDPEAIVQSDLQMLNQSDAVLVKLSKERPSIGTLCEIGYAYAKSKPLIVLREDDDVIHRHPFIEEMAYKVVGDMLAAVYELVMLPHG